MKPLCIILTTTKNLEGLKQYGNQSNELFDLVVIDYTSKLNESPARKEVIHMVYENLGGFKYQSIKKLLDETNILELYEYFWFPDWDIEVDIESIETMVEIASSYNLSLSQPSLSDDSYVSWDITKNNPSSKIRITDFVEVMCPLFSSEFLKEVLWTFSINYSSWGLDFLWASLKGDRLIGIIDSAVVKHSRIISSHEWKLPNDRNANEELEEILKKYNLVMNPQVIKSLI